MEFNKIPDPAFVLAKTSPQSSANDLHNNHSRSLNRFQLLFQLM
ncbi:hypothetical protein HMPREF9103_01510 [Lentilactobacillus parafarraginis F0439]|uniref:Uncharacterized protein n=1 Tax=Lentilactobacillus parafarraginis F0439 TaxID=797515 RepID=G9ZP56_9LACO|nr:hypothetical protein HMPREF9103_01510 [Lentilactobacillus parafarraginis F0439]